MLAHFSVIFDSCIGKKAPVFARDVDALWHLADIPLHPLFGRYRGIADIGWLWRGMRL
jgi:hypothetical protein